MIAGDIIYSQKHFTLEGVKQMGVSSFKKLVLVLLVLLLSGCMYFKESVEESGINSFLGQKVYNRVSLRTFSGYVIWYTNNYHGGILIPAGSECHITDIAKKKITFVYEGREYFLIDWLSDVDRKSIQESFDKYFAKDSEAVGMNDVRPEFHDNVKSGIAEISMNKKEVLLSLGYPSKLGKKVTTNLYNREFIMSQNDWYYATNQDVTMLLKFKGEYLHEILSWKD